MYVPSALNVPVTAFQQGKNLIVSYRPGTDMKEAALKGVRDLKVRHAIINCAHLDPWDLHRIHPETRIVVFMNFQSAGATVQAVIRQLLEKKNADGIPPFEHLGTVVVLMCVPETPVQLSEDRDAIALELARLGPSLSVRIT